MSANYKKNYESLFQPPFTVLDKILDHAIKIKEAKIAEYVYKALLAADRLEFYLHDCIKKEIENTEGEQTAFRLNSKTTRLMNIIYLNQGIGFLYHSLSPLFEEIDKKKIKLKALRNCKSGDKDLTQCARLVNMTFENIMKNSNDCPIMLRRVLRRVFDEMQKKYPNSTTSWVCLG